MRAPEKVVTARRSFAVARSLASTTIPFAIALWGLAASAAAESSAMMAAAMDSITADELYQHVEVLADDVFEGRAAGSRGGYAAAQYLLKQIEPYGLVPAGDDEYIQNFDRNWRNILALIPGSDPELQDEIIIVGAHYDHVGYGNDGNSYGPIGTIHNGADDNASGVAVMLEAMQAFAISGLRTRRSILFAFWDGEERGLVGSRHWLSNPTLPLDRVKLAVTIDMVGRLRDGQLYVLGTRTGYGLRRLMSGTFRTEDRKSKSDGAPVPLATPLWLDFTWELQNNSDHWSFLERHKPSVLLHTGLHRDYHRPSDEVEKINRDGMRIVSRYLLTVLIHAANEDTLPTFREQATRENEGMRRALERPLATISLAAWPDNETRPRLGISWRDDQAEPGSVFITRVVEGTPAEAAGLAVHDRIYELDGSSFVDAAEFQSKITDLLDSKPSEFSLLTERRGQIRIVTVRMASETGETSPGSQEPKVSSN